MVNRNNRSEIIEQGDIFFFYRPKVDTEEVKDKGYSKVLYDCLTRG